MVVLPQPPLLFAIRITMRDGLDERDWEPIPFAGLFCALFMPCLIRFFAGIVPGGLGGVITVRRKGDAAHKTNSTAK